MTMKNEIGKCSLFVFQPIDEKIKYGLFVFPPNIEKALFDWPIVFKYDIKAKYWLICRTFSGMKFFHPRVRLTNQPTVSVR